ncbi:hypothetical protein GQ43DRAFT_442099 [Delitschia confertaspora ATCC 74209]|uniref:Uncharacterized protein n=1 Tax=Delitschia confertaspora ATCC 74209 TaxID=1513339 RepID=A0A9P4JIP7_9PLEO|nr:hypothetical protein GQ43DRAFT_442099 [Delitschia confertaspora ATCC 74209]
MAEPTAKRRRTTPPDAIDGTTSPLKKRPVRPSFASPTKASLARYNPGLLPRATSTESAISKSNRQGEAISRGKQARAYILGGNGEEESGNRGDMVAGAEQPGASNPANITPRAQRTRSTDGGEGQEEEDLPITPSVRALQNQDTPRRGILYSSPSRRPPRQKGVTQESLTRPKDDFAIPGAQDKPAGVQEDGQGGPSGQQENGPDHLLEKKLEKERLQRIVQDLEEEISHYTRMLQEEQSRNANDILGTQELDELIDTINKADPSPTSPPPQEPQPLISLLASFLPFSRPILQPSPPQAISDGGDETPVPSHCPLDLEDPLSYLSMFAPFTYTSSISLPSPLREDYGLQMHRIHIENPSKLLTATIVLTISVSAHEITALEIVNLSAEAECDLGEFVRRKAKERDVGAVFWALGSYWDITKKRAECWHRCEEEFGHLIPGHTELDKENRTGGNKKKRKGSQWDDDDGEVSGVLEGKEKGKGMGLSRKQLHRHLGKKTLVLQSKEVLFQVEWKIGFDWTGEAESEVKGMAAVPRVWTEADERNALKRIPETFNTLVNERGVFEATKVMVALLFGTT